MSSKTVNEDLMIVTQGSKHRCDTQSPKDKCFLKDKKTIVPYRNHILTSACDDKEAAQRTYIRNTRIVHSKSRIGTDYGGTPSTDDNFQGWGGGVANGQVYFKHANDYPGAHSKNVKVEGQWIVRTSDQTQQNKRNCTGKFCEGNGGITEAELEALLNKGCTVESISTQCGHRDTPTDRIGVLEGDTVTVKMVHVNDAEVEPAARAKPKCQVPRRKGEGKLPATAKVHPYFRVTRAAYPKTSWREALPALTKELPGLEITLAVEWLGKAPAKPESGGAQFWKDPKDKPETKKDSWNKVGQVEGQRPTTGARQLRELREDDSHIPAQVARGRAEAQSQISRDMELRQMRDAMQQQTRDKVAATKARDKAWDEARGNSQAVKKLGEIGITSYNALKEVFYAKPVEVKVEALACAGAKSVTIAAYPPSSYSVNLLDLKEVKTVFKAVKDTIAKIRDFLRRIDGVGEREEGAAADVAITVGRYTVAIWLLADSAAELGVEYRELERDSGQAGEAPGRKKHEAFRAYMLDVKFERLVGIKFGASIPLSYATGALGAFAQRLLDKIGADLNFKVELEFSVGLTGSMEFDQYGKIIWGKKVASNPVAKLTFSLNAVSKGMQFSIGATGEWKPIFELEPVKDQPLCIKRLPSTVDIKWYVKAAVNIFGWTVDFEYGDKIWSGTIPESKFALS